MEEISDQNAGREGGLGRNSLGLQHRSKKGLARPQGVLEPKSPIAGAACLTRWPCLSTPGMLSQCAEPLGWPMGSVASVRACSWSQKSDRWGSQSRSAEHVVSVAITVHPSWPQLHFSMQVRKQHLHGAPGPCSRGKLDGANYSPHCCLGPWDHTWC